MSKKIKKEELKNVTGGRCHDYSKYTKKYYCKTCDKEYTLHEVDYVGSSVYCKVCKSYLGEEDDDE